jgi:hypothetical protein
VTLDASGADRAEPGGSAVSPVLAIARSEIRSRWRALVLIGLLAGVVGALAIGGVSLARRTTTAYDRLGDATNVDDAQGSITRHGDLLDDIVELPMVEEDWTGQISVAQLEGEFIFLGITAGPEDPSSILTPVLLDGRLPEASDDPDVIEVAVRDDFQREFDVRPGDEFDVQFLTEADYFSFDTGFEDGVVHGPEATVRVVGVIRLAGGTTTGPPGFASAAMLDSHPDAFVGWRFFVRLEGGAAAYDDFAVAVDELASGRTLPPEAQEFPVVDTTNTGDAAAAVDNTAMLLGRALLAFAGAAVVVGGFAVVQALARHHTATAGARDVERALGLTRTQRTGARLLTGLIPAGLAVLLALAGALVAARIEPIGAIHLYEPHPGSSLNLAVTAIGLSAVLVVVLAASALTSNAGRARRGDAPRESSLVTRVTGLGGSPPTVLGLRFALEPGRGARAVPVRSALTGAMVGLAGVVAGLVFVASLDRLVSSPSRSAVPYDVYIADVTTDALEREGILEHRLVGDVSLIESAPVDAGGLDLAGHALRDLRGSVDIGIERGRLPRTPDEIALGLRAARDLDVDVGDVVTVRAAGGGARDLAVVGTAVVPPFNGEEMGLNALFTPEGLGASAATSDAFTGAAVEAASGADAAELAGMLEELFEASPQNPPVSVQNLDQLGRLPGAVAALVGSVAVLAIANALVVAVRRRGRDLAVLRAIGFTRRQSGASVVVMAMTIVALGSLVGVPVGIAIGSTLWRATADGAFVLSDPSVRLPHVVLPVVGAVLVALVAAAIPAARAASRRASDGLRAE